MSQRIDLYRDDLRPREPNAEFRRNLLLVASAFVLMMLWGAFAQWRDSSSARRLAGLTAEQESLQAEMTAATDQLSQRKPDPALTAALVAAQANVDGRRWLVAQLEAAGEQPVSFAAALEGLGRQRVEPLWLTRIHLGAGGAELGLGGRTVNAAAVPTYLERLGRERPFAGREFTHFTIAKADQAGEPLVFEMATTCAALARGCEPERGQGGAP